MLEDREAPGELDEQDRQIAAYLQRIYDTRAEDAQSLARIRERLQKISTGTLPVSDPVTTPEAAPATRVRSRHTSGSDMPIRLIHSTFREGKTWPSRLSVLAAVLLVAVVAGSLALFLIRIHQGNLGSGTGVFTLRPGWAVVASYSGTGSKTISGRDIEAPRLWGYDYACTGSGKLDIQLTGIALTGEREDDYLGTDKCSTPTTTVAPLGLSLDSSSLRIQTIKVTANASTVWHLLLVEATTQPTLTLGPEWIRGLAIGGVDSHGPARADGQVTTSNGQTLGSKTWGIVSVCFGTSHGYVQLSDTYNQVTPDVRRINLPPCDGQTRLQVVHYTAATTVNSFIVYITGKSVWHVQIVGCADERKCGT
jgi:hypothetical protein